ncbi:MAG TPA: GNAT family N-acetyltransferase [Jatrophihabitans sp.]|nr:GNAT family N-acetyltransferase [Jatrophihabitans sp.]
MGSSVSSQARAGAGCEVCQLGQDDRAEFVELLDRDPLVNAVLRARIDAVGSLEAAHFGGSVLGVRDASGALRAALFSGGTLMPVGGGPLQWAALAEKLRLRHRVCSSIVGRASAVSALWRVLAEPWGPARAVRGAQPLLALGRESAGQLGVRAEGLRFAAPRPVSLAELDTYLPAAEAMFAEELGIVPAGAAGKAEYHRRVARTIAEQRAYAVFDAGGAIVFKADLGAVTAHTCQVQGVWTRPDLRGQGLATAALAGVFRHALELAPTVSLYVNDFNTPARRVYRRLGMRSVATLSTVLF